MQYLKYVKEFEQWSLSHSIPATAELLWYKLLYLWEKSEWQEEFSIENKRLLELLHIKNESSLVRYRNILVAEGLVIFQRGTKGTPSKYRMIPEGLKQKSKEEYETAEGCGQKSACSQKDFVSKDAALKQPLKAGEKRRKELERNRRIRRRPGITEQERACLVSEFGEQIVSQKIQNARRYTGCENYETLYVWCKEEKEKRGRKGSSGNRFNNFRQRTYDFDNFERMLLLNSMTESTGVQALSGV